jgi:hypothetical protein
MSSREQTVPIRSQPSSVEMFLFLETQISGGVKLYFTVPVVAAFSHIYLDMAS